MQARLPVTITMFGDLMIIVYAVPAPLSLHSQRVG